MTNKDVTVFIFQKDLTERGADRFFLLRPANVLEEIAVRDLVLLDEPLITHDFWLIAPSIYKSTNALPKQVIDIREVERSITGTRPAENPIDKEGLVEALALPDQNHEVLKRYEQIFYRKRDFDFETYRNVARCIARKWALIYEMSVNAHELERVMSIELATFNMLWESACKGIRIDQERLKQHKKQINHDFYLALKNFGNEFGVPFEVPSDTELEEYLQQRGFDLSEASLDYILEFIPMPDDFGQKVTSLIKINRSRRALSDIPSEASRVHCIVDSFGTITSRIVLRNPAIQSLAKKYRDIFIADEDKVTAYVDFSQYEIGIMAALSEDRALRDLYESGDLYTKAAMQIFGTPERRKDAKRLFLSYAYGMKIKNLGDAARELGAERKSATNFFRGFSTFEEWKATIASKYENTGKIGTTCGNFLIRQGAGKLSPKEKRSCVSQVVQGTASLIFKKVLLELHKNKNFELLVPMHDAVFFQYPRGHDMSIIKQTFEDVFARHFDGNIRANATINPTFF